MHREYSEACYYGSLGTDLSVERRHPHAAGPSGGVRAKEKTAVREGSGLAYGKGCRYLAGDAVLGVASVLLLPYAGVADVALFVLEFGDAALMPLSVPVAPGVP